MKVALFNNSFYVHGGTERHILDAAELLKAEGIETLFITGSREGSEVDIQEFPELFQYKVFPRQNLSGVFSRLERFLREQQVDLVHLVHMHNPDVTEFLAARWPTVRTIHTAYMFCLAGSRYLPHTQRACPHTCGLNCLATHMVEKCIRYDRKHTYPFLQQIKKLKEIQANHLADTQLHRVGVASAFMKDLLIQHHYPESEIDIIPPPLSPALEAIQPAEFPIQSEPTILFVGRLIPEKGVLDILMAMMRMQVKARLIVVGDGADRSLLEQDAQHLGIADRIEFRGALSPAETLLVYKEAWLTVFPSHWPEPFGFTGIESFLNHRPVVAYDGGGVREWLVPGQNGLLLKAHDIAGLADAMDQLLRDPNTAQRMGEWGDSFVRERFGRKRHVEQKVRFYRQAVEAFNRNRPVVGVS